MTLHDELRADHQRLERLFRDLEDAVEGADAPTIQRIWTEFESGLLAHLAAEEATLLPRLEEVASSVVTRIRDDHARIRHMVSELGVITDLHVLRKEMADELVDRLRRHAEYEDEALYPYIDDVLAEEERRSLRRFLDEGGRRLRARLEGRAPSST